MLKRTPCYVFAFDFDVDDFGKQVDGKYRNRARFRKVGVAGTTDLERSPPYVLGFPLLIL